MSDPCVEWSFTDTTLGAKSVLGTVELPWSGVKKIWRFPEVWLVFFEGGGYSTLPTASLAPELQRFILNRISA
jgi:hypothetical protein